MCLAMALYGTECVSAELALRIGISFFSSHNLSITSAAYYEDLSDGDHDGDHDLVEVTLSELTDKIKGGVASSFRLYNEDHDATPWFASYGFNTEKFGSFFHIDAQASGEEATLSSHIKFFREAAKENLALYGIVYQCDSVSNAFHYSSGENFISVYPFENSGIFKREVPGLYDGQERFKGDLLRMVYQINLLNSKHLSIDVAGKPLRQWILDDVSNGLLEDVTDSITIWLVEKEQLESVNEKLGKLDLLISWKQPVAKTFPKKLP